MGVNYHFGMSLESAWNVLRWILAALAAGFIGQFGRFLAIRIIERRRRAEIERRGNAESLPYELEKTRIEELQKIEKKRAKAEVKRLKKLKKDEPG